MNDARSNAPASSGANPARRLRIFLRDHRVLDANVRVAGGQYLARYLASRNRYVNLTSVRWLGTEEQTDHMALKVSHILWAASQDGDLALTGVLATSSTRRVDVELEGGYLLGAGLLLTEHQRLSDYLQSAPAFIPLRDARLLPRGRSLGDIVVNQEALQVVREQTPPEDAEGAEPVPESRDASVPVVEPS